MSNIEVESRGPISLRDYKGVLSFFEENAKFVKDRNRIIIDYTTCMEKDIRNRNKDIRIRNTDGIPEIMIKIGKWKGSDAREEVSVKAQEGQFPNLLRAFSELGYKKGMACIRKSKIFNYKDIEFTLVEVPDHSYFFEAEIIVDSDDDISNAKKKIKEICEKINLRLFSDEEWFDYIETLNKEANRIYETEIDGTDYFENKI